MNNLPNDRQAILIGFISYMASNGTTNEVIGRNVRYASDFLEKTDSITRTGYLRYRKKHMMAYLQTKRFTEAGDAICELLAYKGVGYRKAEKRKVSPLEKLSAISETNRFILSDFTRYLLDECDLSPNTAHSYYWSVKMYFEYANEVSLESYKRYISTLESEGKSPKTIQLRISALEKLSIFLKKPIKIKRPKVKRSLDLECVPTELEYNRLLEFLSKKRNKDYYYWVKILATTGARFCEFQQFTWEDIINGEVELKGKGNKYRRFFFQKELSNEIRKYTVTNNKTGLFATSRFGAISQRGLCGKMKVWGKHCDIDKTKMHPHAFRHFFAKMFLKKNKDVVQLADLLGHGSIETTRVYLQRSYGEQKRDFNKNVTW